MPPSELLHRFLLAFFRPNLSVFRKWGQNGQLVQLRAGLEKYVNRLLI